ncbi:hypothetical protein D3OALGA1CA_1939 [Olavius algarvensis associated proteobacterium Delta 3]|nr:hypothetical protein D3OALGA1CA_1939 [Olavius algarvensis associated proteobacterium Delta 3]
MSAEVRRTFDGNGVVQRPCVGGFDSRLPVFPCTSVNTK